MATKLALLKTGEYIISDAKELISDEKVCGYLFSDPHKVIMNSSVVLMENTDQNHENTINVTLTPWIILSDDKVIAVSPDWVITIVEPIDSLKEMFEGKVNDQNS